MPARWLLLLIVGDIKNAGNNKYKKISRIVTARFCGKENNANDIKEMESSD